MHEKARLRALVKGRVQGVLFRDFVLRHARAEGLRGYVRNLEDHPHVLVEAEGARDGLERLVTHLRQGPTRARVDDVELEWSEFQGNFAEFHIRW